MQEDFHYYATYCAAFLAGFSHEESVRIAYADNFVDCCTESYLIKVRGPLEAATTQSQPELVAIKADVLALQKITRIWASFHFLPYDLYAELEGRHSKKYMDKYRLICRPNGDLLVDTVHLANGKGLEAVGIAMHILSDTWAHTYFAGTPSLVINNATRFYDLTNGEPKELVFSHNPAISEDLEKGHYINTPNLTEENSIMVLGHGRAGHLPDYSFFRYKYLPAWADYEEVVKDNPADYYCAFCQMIYALKFLRGRNEGVQKKGYNELAEFETDACEKTAEFQTNACGETAELHKDIFDAALEFQKDTYDEAAAEPYRERIMGILEKRQLSGSEDWKAFGEELSGETVPAFDEFAFEKEYVEAADKGGTFLGRFCEAASAQKAMVTNRICKSGSKLAGISVEQVGERLAARAEKRGKEESAEVSARPIGERLAARAEEKRIEEAEGVSRESLGRKLVVRIDKKKNEEEAE